MQISAKWIAKQIEYGLINQGYRAATVECSTLFIIVYEKNGKYGLFGLHKPHKENVRNR